MQKHSRDFFRIGKNENGLWGKNMGASQYVRVQQLRMFRNIEHSGETEQPIHGFHARLSVCRTPPQTGYAALLEKDSVGLLTNDFRSETALIALHIHPHTYMELHGMMHAYAWGYDTPKLPPHSGVSHVGMYYKGANVFQNSLF